MHALLGISSLVLVLVGASLALRALRRVPNWSRRRDVQFLVLTAPVVSLGVGLAGVHHFAGRACFIGAPPWDYMLGLIVPLAMGLSAAVGVTIGVLRLVLLHLSLLTRSLRVDPELQRIADEIASRLDLRPSRVVLFPSGRPGAFVVGLRRPVMVLSSWMPEHLDHRELEAVLAHELSHVARRDFLLISLATMLRDVFFYMPTSWVAYRLLQQEKEFACDDLAVAATGRPLPLASALARVWEDALGVRMELAQPLVGTGTTIEKRIERLLGEPEQARIQGGKSGGVFTVGVFGLLGLVGLQALNATVVLASMGCGGIVFLTRSL